jgi:hypothetical protein
MDSTTFATSSATAFDADIANTTDTDIKSIKVVLGGVDFNATNDKLILDTDIKCFPTDLKK